MKEEYKVKFSAISTILMTVYTVMLVIFGILLSCNRPDFSSAFTNDITYSGFATIATGIPVGMAYVGFVIMMIAVAVASLVCITITAISYLLICRGYFKADAWMKIVTFGMTFMFIITCTDFCGLQMFLIAICMIVPIVLSVMTLFDEAKMATKEETADTGSENCDEKKVVNPEETVS